MTKVRGLGEEVRWFSLSFIAVKRKGGERKSNEKTILLKHRPNKTRPEIENKTNVI